MQQIWFVDEKMFFAGYFIFFFLPALFFLLDGMGKLKWTAYGVLIKVFGLTPTSYKALCTMLFLFVVVCYPIGAYKFFIGVTSSSNSTLVFHYSIIYPKLIVKQGDIKGYRIRPYSNSTNKIGFLEIELKNGRVLSSPLISKWDQDKLDEVIKWLKNL